MGCVAPHRPLEYSSRSKAAIEVWGLLFFFLALLKDFAENSLKQVSNVRRPPILPFWRVGSGQDELANDLAHEMDNILINLRRQAKKAEPFNSGGAFSTPRELSQNPQSPCSISLQLPHPQPPGGIVRRPKARDTFFPYPIGL